MLRGPGRERTPLGIDEAVDRIDQSLRAKRRGLVKRDIDIPRLANIQGLHFDAKPARFRSNAFKLSGVVCVVAVQDHGHLIEVRHQALEYPQAFSDQMGRIHRGPRHVRAGTLQALYQTGSDRIVHRQHDDGDAAGCLGGGDCGRDIRGQNDVDLAADQLGHHAVIFAIQDRFSIVEPDVLAFDVAEFGQSLSKHVKPFWIGILGCHVGQHRHGFGGARCDRQPQQERYPQQSSANFQSA